VFLVQNSKTSLLNYVAPKDAEVAYFDDNEWHAEDHSLNIELVMERRVLERDERKCIADSGYDHEYRRADLKPADARMVLPE